MKTLTSWLRFFFIANSLVIYLVVEFVIDNVKFISNDIAIDFSR